MAAPHVTGVVALMLEADPNLSASYIRGHLILSARKDRWTGDEVWNADRGYGKLDAVEAMRLITDVADERESRMPISFDLSQNTPNPFNATTCITYSIPNINFKTDSDILLIIYDLQGRIVETLMKGKSEPGRHRVMWDGLDDNGRRVSSGVYIYRLVVGDVVLSRKMVLIQ